MTQRQHLPDRHDACTPLDDTHLAAFVARLDIPARLVYPGTPTPTVAAAAAALGVEPRRILKSLVFLAAGEPLLVVAAGEARVDGRALAGALGLSRRRVGFANAAEALALTGFEVGAMPPFGHRRPLRTLIDSRTVAPSGRPATDVLYGGGGSHRALLELTAATLERVTNAEWADLTAEETP